MFDQDHIIRALSSCRSVLYNLQCVKDGLKEDEEVNFNPDAIGKELDATLEKANELYNDIINLLNLTK